MSSCPSYKYNQVWWHVFIKMAELTENLRIPEYYGEFVKYSHGNEFSEITSEMNQMVEDENLQTYSDGKQYTNGI